MTADTMKNKDALPVSVCMILRNEAEKIEDDLGDLDLGDSESLSEEDPEEEPDTKDQDSS